MLVIISGRPLAITEENELADAILFTGHPGVEAGNAIADVVFGDTNPSGKLTVSFPRNVGQIPVYYSMRNTGRPQAGDVFTKFRSNYLDVENSPLYPFGYGLSYTNFEYAGLNLSKESFTGNEEIEISVDVKNTGNADGEEVVQLYVRDVVASVTRPLKELKGFKKVMIKKGETQNIVFKLTANDLAFYDANLNFAAEPGKFVVFVGGDSDASLSGEFELK
jgi:beta-glucosidase